MWQVPVPDASQRFTAVSAGGSLFGIHSCAIEPGGTVTCWGNNQDGQSDAPEGPFTAVDTGHDHSCGLRTDRTITCWGRDPGPVPQGLFASISAGAAHSCALRTYGAIICWGRDGQAATDAPYGVFKAVTAGERHSCVCMPTGPSPAGAPTPTRGEWPTDGP